jgi:hypothetical protein
MWLHPLQILLGPSLWALWFVALYGGLSIACVRAPPATSGPGNWLSITLAIVSLGLAGLLAGCALRCLRAARQAAATSPGASFVGRLAAGTHFAAALSMLFIALPLVRLPPCL